MKSISSLGSEHYLVSTVKNPSAGYETMIFRCTPDGTMVNPDELFVKRYNAESEAKIGHEWAASHIADIVLGDIKKVICLEDFNFETVRIGEKVGQDVVDMFMNALPPAHMSDSCMQLGEVADYKMDRESGNFRGVFETFKKVSGVWPHSIFEYCGRCFRGENIAVC